MFNAKYSCPLIKDNPVISALYIDEMGDIHPCLGLLGHQFKVPNNQVTLAIGGAGEHRVYGYVSDNFIVYSSFDFNKNKFEYEIANK